MGICHYKTFTCKMQSDYRNAVVTAKEPSKHTEGSVKQHADGRVMILRLVSRQK
jgi:hypothetical protein